MTLNEVCQDWTASQNVGYYLKRNFTFGLASPASPSDGAAWGSQAFSTYTFNSGGGGPRGVVSTDATTIACAVNIFGQNNIYRIGNYNGYCLVPGVTSTAPGMLIQCQSLSV
jgi:hypothetical protein